jgi:hypothetical protein
MFQAVQTPTAQEHFAEALHLFTGGLGAAFHLLVICALGWGVVHQMHKHHWHWYWAGLLFLGSSGLYLVGIHSLMFTGPLLGTGGLAVVALLAMRRGARWQRMDKQSGGESAKIASERRTPLWALRGLRIWSERSGAGAHQPKLSNPRRLAAVCVSVRLWLFQTSRSGAAEQLFLGYDVQNRRVLIPMKHTLVVGATEAGKTTTISRMLQEIRQNALAKRRTAIERLSQTGLSDSQQEKFRQAAREGVGVIVIDGKDDEYLEEAARRFADEMKVPFHRFSPDGDVCYLPLAHGGATEIANRPLSAEKYGDDYYLRLGQRYMGAAVRLLLALGITPTLGNLAKYILPENWDALVLEREGQDFPGLRAHLGGGLPEPDKTELQAIRGTAHRLAALAESNIGPLLEPDADGQGLDLLEAVRGGEVVYFSLHAGADPETAKMLGALIMMDLVSVFAVLQFGREYRRTVVIPDDIDEYANEAVIEGVISLYARARSSGAMMILGTQTFGDIEAGRSRAALDKLLGNVRTRIFHAVPGPDSAERASRALGEYEDWDISERLEMGLGGWKGGRSATRRRVIRRHFTASDLMGLPDTEAVIHVRGSEPVLTAIEAPTE